jgi:hypothetical protein
MHEHIRVGNNSSDQTFLPHDSICCEETMMKRIGSAVLGIIGVLAFTATGASAAIVCNELGDCWHVNEKYDYKPEFNLHVYGDDWAFPEGGKYRWREHEGRGYWGPKGAWIEF